MNHHEWKWAGPAPTFAGRLCELWRCIHCGKTWELYVGVGPPRRTNQACKGKT